MLSNTGGGFVEEKQSSSTEFLIKQRAFLKMYILTYLEDQHWYGLQLVEELRTQFKPLAFQPQHSEVYRALYDLEDEGYIKKGKVKLEGSKRAEIAIYMIADKEKAKAYKKLVKADIDRCDGLLRKALADNYS
jgi:DNA-binding PadR family transcriptional regulator